MIRKALVFLLLFACAAPAARADAGDGVTDFGLNWFVQECMAGEENAVISPASAYFALAMAAMGAKGDTRSEICRALGAEDERLEADARALYQALSANRGETKLAAANAAWVDDLYALNPAYARALADTLGAEARSANLQTEETMREVNEWVSARTNGMIERVIDKPFSEECALALINTLYFKAKWKYEFDPADTVERAFLKDDGQTVFAQFMQKKNVLAYFESADGARGVMLDYTDDQTQFMAILPPEGVSADAYAKTLRAGDIAEMRKTAAETHVRLSLPLVDVSAGYDMAKPLADMGVTRAFDAQSADFSGMLEGVSEELCISKAIQKVRMSIGEQGTEAAAVTMIEIAKTSARIEPAYTVLSFDRSYLYLVLDKQTGAALFLGKVTSPDAFDIVKPKAKSGWRLRDGVPDLTVFAGDQCAEAAKGTYSVAYGFLCVNADSAHPLDMKNLNSVGTSGEARLYFGLDPDEITARCWPAACAGDEGMYEAGYETLVVLNNALQLPGAGEYIVEVTAKWSGYSDFSGQASYSFRALCGE